MSSPEAIRAISVDDGRGELGLSDHHENNLIEYLKFCRLQRQSRIATVKALFNDTLKKKVQDETYTKDEIKQLLMELREVTGGELESELINMAHMNLLLFRQLSAQAKQQFDLQAEKFNVNLFMNLSELEDRQLLDAVEVFEKEHFERKTAIRTATILRQLKALEGTTPQERAERRYSVEKSRMLEELSVREAEMADLRRKTESNRIREQQLLNELETVEHRLLQTKKELTMKESELEKKFANTNAFKTMDHLLKQKNQIVKHLRDIIRRNGIDMSQSVNNSENDRANNEDKVDTSDQDDSGEDEISENI
ncbi:unnamed protein product [Anisakis simplex]|uniref:Leucine zipper transcription factor-like protein 1 n=1 Tax=Anisakis simplex TaxID=6269 RepID=A0A0M3KCD9_ANISI|nr:unnamed protein product [Anisakis simplex]